MAHGTTTRIRQVDGGEWPDDTPTGLCIVRKCPQPLLDRVKVLRTKSEYFKDGRFRTNMEVHNAALLMGVEMLEDHYIDLELAITTTPAGDGNYGTDRTTTPDNL